MKFLTTLALAALCLAPGAFAQQPGQKLTGSWLIAITIDGTPAPFTVDMATFDGQGGITVISSDKGESNGVGAYQRTGDREFQSTHTHILFNDKGTFNGIAKVIATLKLNDTGDALTGRYRVEVADATGKVQVRIPGTIAGKLVVPEPL